jgi:hypothetical protein
MQSGVWRDFPSTQFADHVGLHIDICNRLTALMTKARTLLDAEEDATSVLHDIVALETFESTQRPMFTDARQARFWDMAWSSLSQITTFIRSIPTFLTMGNLAFIARNINRATTCHHEFDGVRFTIDYFRHELAREFIGWLLARNTDIQSIDGGLKLTYRTPPTEPSDRFNIPAAWPPDAENDLFVSGILAVLEWNHTPTPDGGLIRFAT